MAKGFELKVVDASGLTDADWTGINKVMSAVGCIDLYTNAALAAYSENSRGLWVLKLRRHPASDLSRYPLMTQSGHTAVKSRVLEFKRK